MYQTTNTATAQYGAPDWSFDARDLPGSLGKREGDTSYAPGYTSTAATPGTKVMYQLPTRATSLYAIDDKPYHATGGAPADPTPLPAAIRPSGVTSIGNYHVM